MASCTGTLNCDVWDSDQTDCQGAGSIVCTWNPDTNSCSGTATVCSAFGDSGSCGAQTGCTWISFYLCETYNFDETGCNLAANCVWNDPLCDQTHDCQSYFNSTDCTDNGCAWDGSSCFDGGGCSGTPTDCTSFGDSGSCTAQSGCSWGGGSPSSCTNDGGAACSSFSTQTPCNAASAAGCSWSSFAHVFGGVF